jgi:asparagine synthase (glutamine-hydrolysing)
VYDLAAHPNDRFIHVRMSGDCATIEGVSSCRLGHRITASGAAPGEGIFAGWEWDGNRLTVFNDRYGFYPLYYFAGPAECAVSPSLSTLLSLGTDAELDYDALAVFLHLGHFLGDDTPFLAIRAVPPHVQFSWQGGKLEVVGDLTVAKPLDLDRSQAIDAYIEVFRHAIRRRIPDGNQFAVLLSGGRDSRHILLELVRNGAIPKFCLTMDIPPSHEDSDALVAARLAEVLGVPHIVLSAGDGGLWEEVEKNVKTNFCADEHAWMIPAAGYLRKRVDTIYDGIGGDVLSAGLYMTQRRLDLFDSGRLTELAEHLVGNRPIPPFLRSRLRSRVSREVAVARLTKELSKHTSAPNPFSAFVFWNRTRREIALSTYGILSEVGIVFSPYLDHAVFDLLAGLHGRMFVDHTFHTEAINRGFPSFALIPYSGKVDHTVTEANSPASRLSWRRFTVDVLRHCVLRRSTLLNKWYLLPRLLRCLCDSRYLSSILWLGPPSVYLHQLELFRDQPRRTSAGRQERESTAMLP